MSAPNDYLERVYAGVLGKIIGVYLGRPFEGWTHQRIETELGEIWNYMHEKFEAPLVVADDDISGTFTFLRALPDHGGTADLTPEQIGL
ncbi:MAG: ADP-ribosylglycohydrolase family protein, partial [Verrucomicrobia bacterium]|nr:ADP-ribosylglycohydrolase family protein [Verrucomicrobiota bacterium]